jgi:hypothetical protein
MMIGFEDRLARVLGTVLGLSLLVACGDGDGKVEALCETSDLPNGYLQGEGIVEVAVGESCPDAADVEPDAPGCSFWEYEEMCGFSRVVENQVYVNDGYSGYYADAGSVDEPDSGTYGYRSVSGPLTVCYYDAVWYDADNTTCGRPLLRDGEPVRAPVVEGRSGWSAGPHPVAAGLSAADRQALTAYWLDCAVMEHASVASFSHFAMDLMRFGAPPELLHGAHQAALDEIEHARLCFALASGFAGQELRPGPLEDPLPPPSPSLMAVAEALVREGCVGETLAAIDAAARLAVARDAAVRDALTVIVKDESAHAALAWRALRWVLDQDDDGAIRARVAEVLAEERERWSTRPTGDTVSAAGRAGGLISRAHRAHELRRAFDEVIAPSWAALA